MGPNASAAPFVDLVTIEIGKEQSLAPAARRSLFIFVDGDLPIGQQWVEAGGTPVIPERPSTRANAVSGGGAPSLSATLVICTRDRPAELERCLGSIALQSTPPAEVIVVDNASRSEETRSVATAAGARYIREDRPGLDFARNTGAVAAAGDIVVYTDDDTELHPRWIENLLAAFDGDDVVAVTGLVLPARLATEAQWLFESEWSFGRGYERIDYGPQFYRSTRAAGCPAWIVGAGANMAFRRSIFDRIGYFDERLDVGAAGCSGDSEYWYRILAAGFTCRYEPTAVVWHHHRLEIPALSSQIYHYMRGHTAALMVQFERTGDWGNLRRAFVSMPLFYARRFLGRLVRGAAPSNRFLGEQVRGAIAGIFFYLRTPRPNYRPPERETAR